MNDIISQFRDAIQAAGITPPENINPNGQIQRFSINGKPKNTAGWYVLHIDGIPAGVFGDYRKGGHQKWRANLGRKLTVQEEDEYNKKNEQIQLKRKLELKKMQANAQKKAQEIWDNAKEVADTHPYLLRKQVKSHGLKSYKGKLLIPLYNNGILHSLQFTEESGQKRFLAKGRIKGCHFIIGEPQEVLCVCEGYATGASIFEATNYLVAISFHAGNLEPVALFFRKKFPQIKLIICADDDVVTEGNPGISKAKKAALATGGFLAIPDFGDNRPQDLTDFNDLAKFKSLEWVKDCIDKAIAPVDKRNTEDLSSLAVNSLIVNSAINEWSEPLPLTVASSPKPYPVQALPESIRAAVLEVTKFVQCPVSLVACSALSTLAVACQGLVDVQRADKLHGPTSLYFLVIAESGERKTTCDSHFTSKIKEWEKKQIEMKRTEINDHEAAISIWNSKKNGLTSGIKQSIKKNIPTNTLEEDLKKHENSKPKPPRIPRLLHGDSTPEALAWNLSSGWHSGGVLSNEAGIVFGGYGMGKESAMRQLALFNVLWDGGTHTVDRRSSPNFVVQGARLSMGLAIQPDTIRSFLEATKGLARGTGFMARFLFACPESTQGTRFFKPAPARWHQSEAFDNRIQTLLNDPIEMNEQGEIQNKILQLSTDAQKIWIQFHDDVERELRVEGELAEIRDVASKASDNAARLAALFHVYEEGVNGTISEEHMERATVIVRWHLYEARRFLSEIVLPPSQLNAKKLDAWLIDNCKRNQVNSINARKVLQLGPNSLRKKDILNETLKILVETDRVKSTEEGRQRIIQINPKLLEVIYED